MNKHLQGKHERFVSQEMILQADVFLIGMLTFMLVNMTPFHHQIGIINSECWLLDFGDENKV